MREIVVRRAQDPDQRDRRRADIAVSLRARERRSRLNVQRLDRVLISGFPAPIPLNAQSHTFEMVRHLF